MAAASGMADMFVLALIGSGDGWRGAGYAEPNLKPRKNGQPKKGIAQPIDMTPVRSRYGFEALLSGSGAPGTLEMHWNFIVD